MVSTASTQAYGARQLLGRWWLVTHRLAPWDRQPRAFLYGGAIVGLAVACLVALWLLGAWVVLRDRVPPLVVAAIAAVWALPVVLAPPMLSQDAYAFLAQGDVASRGAPYRSPSDVLGHSSVLLHAVDPLYRGRVSPYGPLALRLFSTCLAVAHNDPVVALICLRIVVLLAVAVAAWSAWLLAPPARKGLALWLVAANPLVLLHVVGGLHLEGLLMAALGLVWALHSAGRTRWAVVLVLIAASIKVTAIVVLPVLLIVAHRRGGWRAAAEHAGAALGATVVLLLVLAPDPLGWWSAVPGTLRVWDPVSLPTQAALLWATLTSTSPQVALPLLRGVSLTLGAAAAIYLCATASRRLPAATAGFLLLAATVTGPALWPWYFGPAVVCLAIAGGRTELIVAAAASAAAVMSALPMPVVQMQRLTAGSYAAVLLLAGIVLVTVRRQQTDD